MADTRHTISVGHVDENTSPAVDDGHGSDHLHGLDLRTCCVDTATAVRHAVVDRFLVNIQTDVVHSLHGGASLAVSESAWSLSSAFLHQALLHDLFIQTIRSGKHGRKPGSRRSPDAQLRAKSLRP